MNNTIDVVDAAVATRHARWNTRLAGQIAALLVANLTADTVVVTPLLFLPQILEHFRTGQTAWISSGAVLAGAMWAPLLGRSADIHGKRRMLVITLLVGCAGSVVCVVAPDIRVFVLGRLAQGAVLASVPLTAAIVRELCAPRVAMPAVGIVTTGTAGPRTVLPARRPRGRRRSCWWSLRQRPIAARPRRSAETRKKIPPRAA